MLSDEATTNILRRLGGSELLYDANISKCDFMNSRAFRINTTIDIYSRVDLFNEALESWKQAHHFLRCNIVRDNEDRKCFAYAPSSILNSMDNVHLLYFQAHVDNENSQPYAKRKPEDIWKLFLERELSTPMDSNKLLWRLVLIQVASDVCNQFSYYLVFTANHAVIDGRNVIQVLNQLFSFLERRHLDRMIEFKPYDILPALDEHPEIREHKLKSLNDPVNAYDRKKYKIPDGMLVSTPYVASTVFDANTDDIILTFDKQPYASYSDLAEANKNHFTRVEALVYDHTQFLKLLEVCKANGTKLTGCLNILTILATQQVFKQFGKQDADNVYYATTVSMRAHLNPPIDLYRMGYCSLLFEADFSTLLTRECDDERFWSETFWHHARHESEAIHARLDNREYIDICSADDEYQHTFVCDDTAKLFKYHFVLSNRGDMTDVITTENRLFNFVETFSGMAFTEHNQAQVFMHLIESINKMLFWSMTYNKNIISNEVATFHFNFIDNAIRKLIALAI